MGALYTVVIFLHSLTRWFVLAGALWLIVAAVSSLSRSGPASGAPVLAPWRLFVMSFRFQFVLGLLLLFVSPLAQAAWSDFGAAMRAPGLRFFTVEHPTMMIVAAGLAEAGMARARKAASVGAAAKTSLIFGAIALLIILAAIPWPNRVEVARPLLRLF